MGNTCFFLKKEKKCCVTLSSIDWPCTYYNRTYFYLKFREPSESSPLYILLSIKNSDGHSEVITLKKKTKVIWKQSFALPHKPHKMTETINKERVIFLPKDFMILLSNWVPAQMVVTNISPVRNHWEWARWNITRQTIICYLNTNNMKSTRPNVSNFISLSFFMHVLLHRYLAQYI